VIPLSDFGLDYTLGQWIALLAIAGLGGFLRGFAGFGTTLVMVPLFSLMMSPAEAVVIGLAIDVLVMAPMFPGAAREAEWKPIIPLFIGSLAATPLGVYILIVLSADTMRIVIACLVIGSALLMMSGWRYRGQKTTIISFLVGAFSGTTGTAAGIGGPPIVVYMLARDMSATVTRASLNAMAFIKEGVSAVSIVIASQFAPSITIVILILFPSMLIFSRVGTWVFHRVPDPLFRRLLLYFLLFMGIAVLARTVWFS